jgi:NitT/TauT family transport system substrate-binding protein
LNRIKAMLGFVLGAVLCTSAGVASAQQPQKIAIRLDWTPWGVHAPFHLAQQKGWFKQAGLDVELEDGNGSVTTVQIVGSGSSFDVGHASLAPMMIARDKGLPVKAIAAFARKSDVGLLVPKGSGMNSPKALKGKKLVFTAGSLEAPFLDAFLKAGGLSRDQVELLNVEASAKTATYLTGRADGVFSSVPFVLPLVQATKPTEAVLFADYGLQFPSFGLFATEAKIKEKGEALRKFSSVVSGAWTYIYNGGQDEAVKAIIAGRPNAKLDPKALRGQIDELEAFFRTPATQGHPVGLMADTDWAAAVKTLSDNKVIKPGKTVDYYTNALLDPDLIKKIGGR